MAKWLSTLFGCLCILWASITIAGCSSSDNNSMQPTSMQPSSTQPSSMQPSSTSSSTSPGFGPGGPGSSPGGDPPTPGFSETPTTPPRTSPTTPTISPGGTLNGVTPVTPTMSPGGTLNGVTPVTPTMSPGGTLNGVTPVTPTISPGGTLNGVSPVTPTMSPGGTLNGVSPATPTINPGGTLNGVTPVTPTISPGGTLITTAGISPVMMASTQRSTGVVRQILLAEDSTRDIYVHGDFTSYQGSTANELIRLHADGSVANRFGQGFDGPIYRIALANTGGGELYVSGAFAHFDGQPVPHLVRLTRTGSLDPAFRFAADFDPGGIAVAEDGSGEVYSVSSGPNLDCGQCAYALQIARLNADGSVDPAFSTGHGFPGGLPSNANPAWIQALLPTSNGKLSVGGSLLSYNGVAVSSLVRLNVDGTLDTTFMSNVGYTSAPVVEVMAPVGPGTQDIYIGGRIGLFRVLETGAFDPSFTAAVPMITFSIAPAQDGTGDLYASGLADNRIRLLRFNRNGAVVSTFQEPNLDAEVLTIVPLPDGTRDLYIGGAFTTYSGVAVNHIARVHADGSLASTFSGP